MFKKICILFFMSIGTFAIGTDAFIIAGILDNIADDLQISIFKAGLLISVFSFSYMIFSPLSAWMFGNRSIKFILILAASIFILGNLIIFISDSYYILVIGRIIAAFGAASFTPQAAVAATKIVSEKNKAKAIAVVYGGMTISIALGVPLGTYLVHIIPWRDLFLYISILSLVSIIGIMFLFNEQLRVEKSSLLNRLQLLKNKSILIVLLITFFVVCSEHVVYSYISVILEKINTFKNIDFKPLAFFTFGLGAVIGNYSSGILTDKFGGRIILLLSAFIQTAAIFIIMSTTNSIFILFLMFIWGATGWMYLIPIQHKLIALASKNSSLAIALNSSILYLAIGFGGLLGGFIYQFGSQTLLSIFSLFLGVVGVILTAKYYK